MRTIRVNPEELEMAAIRMNQSNEEYERCIGELFSVVDVMQTVWSGKDNQAFTTEIQKFEGDFRQLAVLCKQYQDFLKTSANSYRDTQDELAAEVSRLVSR